MNLYHEEQRFHGPLVVLPLIALALWMDVITILFALKCYLGADQMPFWPMPNARDPVAIFVVGQLVTLAILGIAIWIYKMRLIIDVDTTGINLRMLGTGIKKMLSFAEIRSLQIKEYSFLSMIKNYGGWGAKRGIKGQAFNMRYTKGIELSLTNGRYLFIGSKNPTRLQSAMMQAGSKREH